MPLVLIIVVIFFSILFFKKINRYYLKEEMIAGICWFSMYIILDLLIFLPESPMQMSFFEYVMDIGLIYLIIIFFPPGIGYILENKFVK